jgi:hypothetical protein
MSQREADAVPQRRGRAVAACAADGATAAATVFEY